MRAHLLHLFSAPLLDSSPLVTKMAAPSNAVKLKSHSSSSGEKQGGCCHGKTILDLMRVFWPYHCNWHAENCLPYNCWGSMQWMGRPVHMCVCFYCLFTWHCGKCTHPVGSKGKVTYSELTHSSIRTLCVSSSLLYLCSGPRSVSQDHWSGGPSCDLSLKGQIFGLLFSATWVRPVTLREPVLLLP